MLFLSWICNENESTSIKEREKKGKDVSRRYTQYQVLLVEQVKGSNKDFALGQLTRQ